MRGQKFFSLVLSAAMGAAAVSGVFVTQERTAAARTTETDYIGTSAAAETFDDYSGAGWDKTLSALGSQDGFGIHNVTEIEKPEVGSAVSGGYPTYVSGNALAVRKRGGGTNTAQYSIANAVSVGKVYLKTDIGEYTTYGTVHRGGSIGLYNSDGADVLLLSIPNSDNSRYTVSSTTGEASKTSSKKISSRKAAYDGLRLETVIDLDKHTADVMIDYVANDGIRYQDTFSSVAIGDTDIASLRMSVDSQSSNNMDTMIDNTRFYSTAVVDPATGINVSYQYDGAEVRADDIDISDKELSAGESCYYTVPAYFEGADGNLYRTSNSIDDHGTLYQHKVNSLSAGTTEVTENVTLAHERGTYQFVDFDSSDPVGHEDHCSNGKVSNTGSSAALLTVEDDGIYDITIATAIVRGGTSFTGTLTSNGKTVVSDLVYGTYANARTYSGIHLEGGKPLGITGSDSRAATDYVLIKKIAGYTYPEAAHSATERRMEKLGRGAYAVYTGSGVYLSWRLLGSESLANQAFDIYRDGNKIYTTGAHDATNHTDASGTASSSYIVVPKGESIVGEAAITPVTNYRSITSDVQGTTNMYSYYDIPISRPEWATPAPAASDTGSGSSSSDKTEEDGSDTTSDEYTANDASVGDLDGDGEYDIVLKWNPSNAKDNSHSGLTSNVIIDAYKQDGTQLWRIDLGRNIRAGAHYTQFIVYDLDGDGKAEVAMKTAPGSKDGRGAYVNAVMDRALTDADDNDANYRNAGGYILGGPEYLTVFDGETGAALCTTDHIARGRVSDWGDSYGNRVDRSLAGVAYLDGVHPSLIMTRGYYAKAVAAAYSWDGESIKKLWQHDGNTSGEGTLTAYDINGNAASTEVLTSTIYGQGNHSLGVCDADNDGRDEIVFGSAVIDDNGRILNNTGHGHGDAHHISDFNNDGQQEIFSIHESRTISAAGYADELRKAADGTVISGRAADVDNARGIMGNFLDDEAYGLSQFWSWGLSSTCDDKGNEIASNVADQYPNFAIYWDGDLARELLNGHDQGAAYFGKAAMSDSSIGLKRFYFGTGSGGSYPNGVALNNGTKANACLTADIIGDWREEVIIRGSDGTFLRVFVSAAPTDNRLYTLMHDSQYRTGVAMENVGYNQPPHTSYYIGSAALAKDTDGTTLNYLAPAVVYSNSDPVGVPELITLTAAQVEDVTDRRAGYRDAVVNNTIELPSGVTVSADDITITIGGVAAKKNRGFYEKFTTLTGGDITFNAAITDIPDGTVLNGISVVTVVNYVVNETAKKKATASVDVE